jgi:hypothetical protein
MDDPCWIQMNICGYNADFRFEKIDDNYDIDYFNQVTDESHADIYIKVKNLYEKSFSTFFKMALQTKENILKYSNNDRLIIETKAVIYNDEKLNLFYICNNNTEELYFSFYSRFDSNNYQVYKLKNL